MTSPNPHAPKMIDLRFPLQPSVTQHLSGNYYEVAIYPMVGLCKFNIARICQLM
jgi:hypothetical protein